MSDVRKISFVIPCYRSENTISIVVNEVIESVGKRNGFDYEILLVNDGSPDNVWSVIESLSKNNDKIIGINLAKNFGQHSALLAGYNNCSGDLVVSLDDDGQTPIDELYTLVDELDKGFDVVCASYDEVHQNLFRKMGSKFAKAMSNYVFDLKGDDRQASSYYIAKKFIIEEMIKYTNPYPYIAGLLLRTTRNIGFVFIHQRDRYEGKSGYSFKSLVSLWLNGFTAFSVKPLQFSTYIGFFTACIGFIFAFITIIRKLFINPNIEAGWSSIIAIVLFIGGIIMIMLGMIGEYIGRIYICINNSPQFVIKQIVKKDEVEKEK